jgi:hypothetical protein
MLSYLQSWVPIQAAGRLVKWTVYSLPDCRTDCTVVDIDISKAQRETVIIRDTARMAPIRLHKPKSYPLRLRPIVQNTSKYAFGPSNPPTTTHQLIPDEGVVRDVPWGRLRSQLWIVDTTRTEANHALLLTTGTGRSKAPHYFHSSIPSDSSMVDEMAPDLDEDQIIEKLAQRLCDVDDQNVSLIGCARSVVLENGDRVTTKLVESCFLGTTLYDIHVKVDFNGEY